MSIKDDLHRLVDELPEPQLHAIERLFRTSTLPERLDLQELIAQQGFHPLHNPLALAEGIWPEGEEVDEFPATREMWRQEDDRG